MDLRAFCRQSSIVLVLGKGGVGKSTVAAALARAAAGTGLSALLVGLDDSTSLPRLFARTEPLGYETTTLEEFGSAGRVRARTITSNAALLEYLERHGLARVARRLLSAGLLEAVATAIPGIKEVLVLGKVRQLEEEGAADLIVLDAPASGHAMTLLTSARGLFDVARAGPLREQAAQVSALLSDPARCQVLLVTIPEETPTNEAIETAFRLEDEAGVALGPVVVNGLYPTRTGLEVDPASAAHTAGVTLGAEVLTELRRAARLRSTRSALQHDQLARLARELPLPQLALPFLFAGGIGPDELRALTGALGSAIGRL